MLALHVFAGKVVSERLRDQIADVVLIYYRKSEAVVRAQDVAYLFKHGDNSGLLTYMILLAGWQSIGDLDAIALPGFNELMSAGGALADTVRRGQRFVSRVRKQICTLLWQDKTNCFFYTPTSVLTAANIKTLNYSAIR